MCGIAGIFTSADLDSSRREAIQRMCEKMRARGPDGLGYWHDPNVGLSLGHRRLSIIDLDKRANQPMISQDGNLVIVFNGEIYNFSELRRTLELKGEVFRTESDTEVLLKLYQSEGEAMLPKLRGMFAFAIWNRKTNELFLARDPYGIKPLYIARCKQGWLFASQVKALLSSKLVNNEPDLLGQAGFWLFGSVPEPHTWFKDISPLPAGSWCRFYADGHRSEPQRYWNIANAWREAPACHASASEVQEVVREVLARSVQQHLVSDVPIGVFLSGGIDSASLAAMMSECGVASLKGVTIAFDEFKGEQMDEVPIAAEIARQYGIHHHVRRVTKEEFMADMPQMLAAMDQPSIDGINTWYASKAVAELGIKVVVSGLGGDELFYGYPSFRQLPTLVSQWKTLHRIPGALSTANVALRHMVSRTGNTKWRWLTKQGGTLYGAYWLKRGLFTPEELPRLMGVDINNEALEKINPTSIVESMTGRLPGDEMAAVGQIESMMYLRNQLLRDSDWASMAHGVEIRTPLVDAWMLRELMPVLRSFGRVNGKSMLAGSPKIPLTKEITNRKKTGFGIPIGRWIAGEKQRGNRNPSQNGDDSRKWAKKVAKEIYDKE